MGRNKKTDRVHELSEQRPTKHSELNKDPGTKKVFAK